MESVASAQARLEPALPPERPIRVGSIGIVDAFGVRDEERAEESPPLAIEIMGKG